MKKVQQDRGGTDAVGIIISVNEDSLLAGDGRAKEGDGLLHAFHEEGIVEVSQGRVEEAITCFGRDDAPGDQQRVKPGIVCAAAGDKSAVHAYQEFLIRGGGRFKLLKN